MSSSRTAPLVLVLGVLGTGFGLGHWFDSPPGGPTAARELGAAFHQVSQGVGPAVVSVQVRLGNGGHRQGSGVVVREDGVVVTNFHVVRDADRIHVVFADERRIAAELAGGDPEADLAVLQLEEPVDTVASFRRSDVETGEWVLAIGNPRGIGHTVTAGIVSGTGRTDLQVATFEDFIQTDAAINSGNSGGPLVDLDGLVVGINTAMGTRFGGTVGLGFAIPSRMVVRVVDDVLTTGRVRRGWLGVRMRTLTAEQLEERGYRGVSRTVVYEVLDGTPADLAGLRAGDIMESIAGRVVTTHSDVLNTIGDLLPAQQVAIELWRKGRSERILATLTERQTENL